MLNDCVHGGPLSSRRFAGGEIWRYARSAVDLDPGALVMQACCSPRSLPDEQTMVTVGATWACSVTRNRMRQFCTTTPESLVIPVDYSRKRERRRIGLRSRGEEFEGLSESSILLSRLLVLPTCKDGRWRVAHGIKISPGWIDHFRLPQADRTSQTALLTEYRSGFHPRVV